MAYFRRQWVAGNIRRSNLIGHFGPGSIVDFRTAGQDGGPISMIVSGTDSWEEKKNCYKHQKKIILDRLAESLSGSLKTKIEYFVEPPEYDEDSGKGYFPRGSGFLSGYRFPRWLQCPSCSLIKPAWQWKKNEKIDEADVSRWCDECYEKNKKKKHTVPVRFIVACDKGHVNDFPWNEWFESKQKHLKGCDRPQFELQSKGLLSLKGLRLKCRTCSKINGKDYSVGMEGIFGENALGRITKCFGNKYWIDPNEKEDCNCVPKALQRGASNLYFAKIKSAIDIPPWSTNFQKKWDLRLHEFEQFLKEGKINTVKETLKMRHKKLSEEEINKIINQIQNSIEQKKNTNSENLESDEYRSFTDETNFVTEEDEFNNFQIRNQKVPDHLSKYIDLIHKVVRLREIRTLYSFTRIKSGSEQEGNENFCSLSKSPKKWLPGIEVKGEGIFVKLKEETLKTWEKQKGLNEYDKIIENVKPRFALIHTLSHLIMRYISIECGYSTSSIRERIYAPRNEKDDDMAGFLIYTSSSDAEGTLGGLSRLADTNDFDRILTRALETTHWCSQDPLCIKGFLSNNKETNNFAACHSCCLLPETSCTEHNHFLDRSLIFGNKEKNIEGFFSPDFFKAKEE